MNKARHKHNNYVLGWWNYWFLPPHEILGVLLKWRGWKLLDDKGSHEDLAVKQVGYPLSTLWCSQTGLKPSRATNPNIQLLIFKVISAFITPRDFVLQTASLKQKSDPTTFSAQPSWASWAWVALPGDRWAGSTDIYVTVHALNQMICFEFSPSNL